MNVKVATLSVAGLVITLILYFFVDIYLAGIVFIIFAVVVMSLLIMQDSINFPDFAAELRADAKAVVLKNTGNARAIKIHGMVIPLNIEFDIPSLDPEAVFEYQLATMVGEVKIAVTFENEKGDTFRRAFSLNALVPPFDPLKPMFPVFRWK